MVKDKVKRMSKVLLAGFEDGWKAADTAEYQMRAMSMYFDSRGRFGSHLISS